MKILCFLKEGEYVDNFLFLFSRFLFQLCVWIALTQIKICELSLLFVLAYSFMSQHLVVCNICSVEHSNGQRVRLDLRNVPQFSFFPGQVRISRANLQHVVSSFC